MKGWAVAHFSKAATSQTWNRIALGQFPIGPPFIQYFIVRFRRATFTIAPAPCGTGGLETAGRNSGRSNPGPRRDGRRALCCRIGSFEPLEGALVLSGMSIETCDAYAGDMDLYGAGCQCVSRAPQSTSSKPLCALRPRSQHPAHPSRTRASAWMTLNETGSGEPWRGFSCTPRPILDTPATTP